VDRQFPIMPPDKHNERQYIKARGIRIIDGVPWAMMEEHEAQAEKSHDQSLRVLAGRRGLSACEAVAEISDGKGLFHQCLRRRGHGPGNRFCKQHAKIAVQHAEVLGLER